MSCSRRGFDLIDSVRLQLSGNDPKQSSEYSLKARYSLTTSLEFPTLINLPNFLVLMRVSYCYQVINEPGRWSILFTYTAYFEFLTKSNLEIAVLLKTHLGIQVLLLSTLPGSNPIK